MEQPSQGQLRQGGTLNHGELVELLDGRDVMLEVARLPVRLEPAHVGLVVLAGWLGSTSDDATPEQGVGDESDAELFEEREELLNIALEQGVLGLEAIAGLSGPGL